MFTNTSFVSGKFAQSHLLIERYLITLRDWHQFLFKSHLNVCLLDTFSKAVKKNTWT